MFTNRFINILIGMSVVVVTLWTASFNTTPKNNETYQDYAQRHPSGVIVPVTGLNNESRTSDYYQRHRSELMASRPLDTTEYFLRHPELRMSVGVAVDLTDYFSRQPKLSSSTNDALAASDYFMRHPELSSPANGIDLTDYFFRQPALLPSPKTIDLTDYYFRQTIL